MVSKRNGRQMRYVIYFGPRKFERKLVVFGKGFPLRHFSKWPGYRISILCVMQMGWKAICTVQNSLLAVLPWKQTKFVVLATAASYRQAFWHVLPLETQVSQYFVNDLIHS